MPGFYSDKISSSIDWEASMYMTVRTGGDQDEEVSMLRRVMLLERAGMTGDPGLK